VAYRPTARTEARKAAVRDRIVAAARRLISRGGYAEAQIAAVAAAAGVATGGDGAEERLAVAVETFARRALRGRRLAYALIAEPVDPAVEAERLIFRRAYRDVFSGVISAGIEGGELPAQVPDVAASALVGAIGEALVGPVSPRSEERDPDEVVGALVRFCVRSITGKEPALVTA
jgi:AcrR family transcriptional regulator